MSKRAAGLGRWCGRHLSPTPTSKVPKQEIAAESEALGRGGGGPQHGAPRATGPPCFGGSPVRQRHLGGRPPRSCLGRAENPGSRPSSASPLGLRTLEHEFGGLDIGVFGHGSALRGGSRVPVDRREDVAKDGERALTAGDEGVPHRPSASSSSALRKLPLPVYRGRAATAAAEGPAAPACLRFPRRSPGCWGFFFFFPRPQQAKRTEAAPWWTRRSLLPVAEAAKRGPGLDGANTETITSARPHFLPRTKPDAPSR